jgi:hypothetical protein
MTLVWFIVWFVCNLIGDEEVLTFDPVNWWAGFLLFAIAIDLAGVHASGQRKR